MSDASVRIKIRSGQGHSPSSLLDSELALRTDTHWLYFGDSNQSPSLLYGQNVIPLERLILSGNYQLSLQNKRFQFLDAGGQDRDVILPVQTIVGLVFLIRNVGTTHDLIIKEGSTVIGTLGNTGANAVKSGKEGIFIFDGVNWEVTFYG